MVRGVDRHIIITHMLYLNEYHNKQHEEAKKILSKMPRVTLEEARQQEKMIRGAKSSRRKGKGNKTQEK